MAERVLIVDDDPSTLRILGKLLTVEGYAVACAGNGTEALRLVEIERVRLIITDWMMPEMDGLDLCRAIRSSENAKSAYVIILTAHTDKGHLVEAFGAGADDFLSKPPNRLELLARVRAGERILGLQKDLVRQAQIAQERDQLRNAVTAFEQVLGVVSHELRTPLAGTRAMTEFLLAGDARSTQELDGFLSGIHEQVVHMAETVNDLLDVARLNGGTAQWRWSTVVVADACREALQTISPLVAHEKVGLTSQITPPDLTMQGDAGAIRRLLVNLLSNAQRHTEAGSIDVQARAFVEGDSECVQFEVRDTGQGIEAEIVDRLGVAFALNSGAVGDGHVQGAGLGLSICRGIVAAHGGEMHLRSKKGAGTTVSVLLRADLPEAASTTEVRPFVAEVAP